MVRNTGPSLSDLTYNPCNSHCPSVLWGDLLKGTLKLNCLDCWIDASWGQPWCIISVALQRSAVTVMDNPGIEWRGEKMIRWTEREEEKQRFQADMQKKADIKKRNETKATKGKGEISLKRSKLNQSIQFSSVAIFSESALDRDYIGNGARKSERGRETQRENGKREGCWPTLNGNSNTAPESAKQREKKRNWKGERDDRSFLLQEAFQPNLNSVIILPETLLSYTGLCLRAALWNHPTFTGILGTAVQTTTNQSSFTVSLWL